LNARIIALKKSFTLFIRILYVIAFVSFKLFRFGFSIETLWPDYLGLLRGSADHSSERFRASDCRQKSRMSASRCRASLRLEGVHRGSSWHCWQSIDGPRPGIVETITILCSTLIFAIAGHRRILRFEFVHPRAFDGIEDDLRDCNDEHIRASYVCTSISINQPIIPRLLITFAFDSREGRLQSN